MAAVETDLTVIFVFSPEQFYLWHVDSMCSSGVGSGHRLYDSSSLPFQLLHGLSGTTSQQVHNVETTSIQRSFNVDVESVLN